MRGRHGIDGRIADVRVQRVAAYRSGPEGNTASAISTAFAKAKTWFRSLIPASTSFAPSFA